MKFFKKINVIKQESSKECCKIKIEEIPSTDKSQSCCPEKDAACC
ncbi:hypothetical protein [Rossellomorea vietnamensis]|nr:hypothetical protein [Rossellomorea vietnamensis]